MDFLLLPTDQQVKYQKQILKHTILLASFFIIFSCKSDFKTTDYRQVYINHGSNPKFKEFEFIYFQKDSLNHYTLKSISDTLTHLKVQKHQSDDFLVFGNQAYRLQEGKGLQYKELGDYIFNFYYVEEPADDETGPLLFNSKYGLLGIYNVFGPNFIFLKTENLTLAETIEEDMFSFKYPKMSAD